MFFQLIYKAICFDWINFCYIRSKSQRPRYSWFM